MRVRRTTDGLTVRAIAGPHVVLLGMDMPRARTRGLLGFAIQRSGPGGQAGALGRGDVGGSRHGGDGKQRACPRGFPRFTRRSQRRRPPVSAASGTVKGPRRDVVGRRYPTTSQTSGSSLMSTSWRPRPAAPVTRSVTSRSACRVEAPAQPLELGEQTSIR